MSEKNDFQSMMEKVAKENAEKLEKARREVEKEKEAERQHKQEVLAEEQAILDRQRIAEEEKRAQMRSATDEKLDAAILLLKQILEEKEQEKKSHGNMGNII